MNKMLRKTTNMNRFCKIFSIQIIINPVRIYLLKVNNKNTRTRCEICSKLTIKTPERRQWRRSGVFANFEHVIDGWERCLRHSHLE